MTKIILIATIALISFARFSESCYIRGCPFYGKRQIGVSESHYCPACMNGLGQCVGPHTCCGSQIGCVMTGPMFNVGATCATESSNPAPCVVRGAACSNSISGTKVGNCVADGVCCEGDVCLRNEECVLEQSDTLAIPQFQQLTQTDQFRVAKIPQAPRIPKLFIREQSQLQESTEETAEEESEETDDISNAKVVSLLKQLLKSHRKAAQAQIQVQPVHQVPMQQVPQQIQIVPQPVAVRPVGPVVPMVPVSQQQQPANVQGVPNKN